jgi:diguanylate cyclase (GGDEF)-like protein
MIFHASENLPDKMVAVRHALELVSEPVFIIDIARGRVADVNAAALHSLATTHDQVINRAWNDIAARLGHFSASDIDGCWTVVVVPATTEASLKRDTLTGLPTRESLASREASQAATHLAVLFIDLDGFKQVNDTFGHAVGDYVLKVCSQRLLENVRPVDLVVRYGGDEFVVVVESMPRRGDVDRLARRIWRCIRQPVLIDGRAIAVSASIGIAEHMAGPVKLEALITAADRAMYCSKHQQHLRNALLPSV